MLPTFLLPETEIHQSGLGPVFDLGSRGGRPVFLLVTLGITQIVEQESINVTLDGSVDGESWSMKPLLAFSQKFYCGSHQMLLDLQPHDDCRYLRPKWGVNRWGRGDLKPSFNIYLFAREHTIAGRAGGVT